MAAKGERAVRYYHSGGRDYSAGHRSRTVSVRYLALLAVAVAEARAFENGNKTTVFAYLRVSTSFYATMGVHSNDISERSRTH